MVPSLRVLFSFLVVFSCFSLGRVVLYTVFVVFPLPETLVKTLAKNLVKTLANNLVKNLAQIWIVRIQTVFFYSFLCFHPLKTSQTTPHTPQIQG